MPLKSAGILLYRRKQATEVFLVHPGGPYWRSKDAGAWSIPKGLLNEGENPLDAARREFNEETGFDAAGPFRELGTFQQPGGNLVIAFAAEGDCEPDKLASNLFSMEWPPRSGKVQEFPEVDKGAWFIRDQANEKILKGQLPLLNAFFDRLAR